MAAHPKDLDPSESPRAFYGSELRRLRDAAGLSQERLGEKLFCSGAYIGQLEAAVRKPQLDMAKRLDEALGTDGYFERLCPMVTKSRHAEYFAEVAELESLAESICEFAPALVPGLLQVDGYARAVTRAAMPSVSDDEIEERVRARLDRAKLLDVPTRPLFWCILHESLLRMAIGGPSVMSEQLLHIVDCVLSRRVHVQVLPHAAGANGYFGESVFLMTFADAPPLAYAEGLHTGHLLEDPRLVAAYQRSYDFSRAVALSPEASLALIRSAAEDYRT
jgi:transcriptional regulator with XRE-family HTH domain